MIPSLATKDEQSQIKHSTLFLSMTVHLSRKRRYLVAVNTKQEENGRQSKSSAAFQLFKPS